MSTKIYNGYRLPRSVDVFAFANVARDLAKANRRRLEAEEMKMRATRIADQLHLGLVPDGDPNAAERAPLVLAVAEWNRDQREATPGTRDYDPHSFGLDFTPDPKGRFYGVVAHHDSHDSVMQRLVADHGLEEYGYWDNSDRAEGLTAAQWTARRLFWERTLPDGTFGGRGLSIAPRYDGHIFVRDIVASIFVLQIPVEDSSARAAGVEFAVLAHVAGLCRAKPLGMNEVFTLMRRTSRPLCDRIETLLPHLTTSVLTDAVAPRGTLDLEVEALAREHLAVVLGDGWAEVSA